MFWMMSRILAWNLLESATSCSPSSPDAGVHGGPHVLHDVQDPRLELIGVGDQQCSPSSPDAGCPWWAACSA